MAQSEAMPTSRGGRYDFDPKEYLQQGPWRDVRLGLHRTEELLERLGRPQDALKIVHVAGTNGKGSTSAFIAGILQAAGYKTGLFTSPYILRFNERIQIDRHDISDADLLEVAADVREQALLMDEQPTAFELITAAALLHFAQQRCDAVVLEVGLGGRLDSTNVVTPEVSVITPIDLDHTHVLGDTIEKIAREKAGIIKPGVPVVSYRQKPDAKRVIEAAAAERGCAVTVPDFDAVDTRIEALSQVFSYRGLHDVRLKLAGSYQPNNAAMAVETAFVLRERGFDISDDAIKHGLESTVWQGRFEVVDDAPITIVDGGHNEQGAAALASSLRAYFPEGGVAFAMSVLCDKNYRAMIADVLPLARAFFCFEPPDNDRALSADDLADAVRAAVAERADDFSTCVAHPQIFSCATPREAVMGARALAGADGVACCFGSLYSIQEIMAAIDEDKRP
ncbi:MAG: folylpolyglutamate synthase/dihydrofolate synthase family protein [Slackia sp.]|nr:folylpolyglutamate synthase/dihydrofolate synthase family protein [Slackia sp.]